MDNNLRLLTALRAGIDAAIKHYKHTSRSIETPAAWVTEYMAKRPKSHFTAEQIADAASEHGQKWAASRTRGIQQARVLLQGLADSPDNGVERAPGKGRARFFHP